MEPATGVMEADGVFALPAGGPDAQSLPVDRLRMAPPAIHGSRAGHRQ